MLSEEEYTHQLLGNVKMWRGNGCEHLVTELAGRVRNRWFDIVDDPKDYRWGSYAAAVAGDQAARQGIGVCFGAPQ